MRGPGTRTGAGVTNGPSWGAAWALALVALVGFGLLLRVSAILAAVFAVMICLACVIVVSRAPMASVGVVLLTAFSFTASWDEVTIGGVKPRLLFLISGLALLGFGHAVRHPPAIPWWIHVFALTAVAVTLIQYVLPISERYLSSRYLTSTAGQSLLTRPGALPSILSFAFNVYAVPLGVVLACSYRPTVLRRLVSAYVTGAAVSSLAAYLGFEGNDLLLTPLVPIVPPAGTRALGFGSHPLHLATSAMFAIGLACWMSVQQHVVTRWLGRVSVLLLLLGLYASGSRGGNAAGVLAIALCVVLLPSIRRRIHVIAAAFALGLAVVISAAPGVGIAILRTTRIYGGTTNAVSDQGRNQVLNQGLADFRQSPVYGIGVRYLSEAHTLYAGVLASGGLLLFAAYLAFNVGSIRAAVRSIGVDRALGGALTATLLASLAYWAVADEFAVASVMMVYGFLVALLLTAGTQTGGPSVSAPELSPPEPAVR